jgi:hypothetical protein
MFVTSGAEQHPMHQSSDISCAIRRVNNKTVWYLYSMDIETNEAVWTRQFHRAHLFKNKELAIDFIQIFLGERGKECDTFSEYETWSI